MELKKVLIAAPIGSMKQYSINEWFKWISNQGYKNYDIAVCVNGDARHRLFELLKQVEITDIHGQVKKINRLMLCNSDKLTIIQKITFSREKIRRFAVENNYDYVFWLDTDTIPANINAISQLMRWGKESISGLYFYKHSQQPVIIDLDTHTNVAMHRIKELVDKDEIMMIWGSGYGCLLQGRKALQVAFDYDLFGEERSDDFGHTHAVEQAGIARWFYPMVLCKHLASSDEESRINKFLGINDHKINKDKSLNTQDGKDTSAAQGHDQGMGVRAGESVQDE